MAHRITLIPGDGIGPELGAAARRVIEASGAAIDWDVQDAGEGCIAAESRRCLRGCWNRCAATGSA